MIALPIYLQMVFEYNAMQAGLSMAPLSLSMFAVALLAGRKAGNRRPATIIRAGFALTSAGVLLTHPSHTSGGFRLVPRCAPVDRRLRTGAARIPIEQLHIGTDIRGAGQ